jgi:hypothetical protein
MILVLPYWLPPKPVRPARAPVAPVVPVVPLVPLSPDIPSDPLETELEVPEEPMPEVELPMPLVPAPMPVLPVLPIVDPVPWACTPEAASKESNITRKQNFMVGPPKFGVG